MLVLVMHDLIGEKNGMKLANAMHATHTRRANRYLRLCSEFMSQMYNDFPLRLLHLTRKYCFFSITWLRPEHYIDFQNFATL